MRDHDRTPQCLTEAKLMMFGDAEVVRGLDITARRAGGLVLEGVVTANDGDAVIRIPTIVVPLRRYRCELCFAYGVLYSCEPDERSGMTSKVSFEGLRSPGGGTNHES